MQKIILDTNVLVSALIQRSYPFYIVDHLFAHEDIYLCLSDELFREYYAVLNRDKFARFSDFASNAQKLLADIDIRAVKYFPTERLSVISDADDNKLLELAQTCKADYLITGNTNDFTMPSYKGTRIVTPRQYWEEHRPQ